MAEVETQLAGSDVSGGKTPKPRLVLFGMAVLV
jgi:hypothetical protein